MEACWVPETLRGTEPLINPHGSIMWFDQEINLYCVLSHPNLIWGLLYYPVLINSKVSPWFCFPVLLCQKIFDPKTMYTHQSCTYAGFCPIKNILLLLFLFLVESQGCANVQASWAFVRDLVKSYAHWNNKKIHNVLERWIVPGVYSASEISGVCVLWL